MKSKFIPFKITKVSVRDMKYLINAIDEAIKGSELYQSNSLTEDINTMIIADFMKDLKYSYEKRVTGDFVKEDSHFNLSFKKRDALVLFKSLSYYVDINSLHCTEFMTQDVAVASSYLYRLHENMPYLKLTINAQV